MWTILLVVILSAMIGCNLVRCEAGSQNSECNNITENRLFDKQRINIKCFYSTFASNGKMACTGDNKFFSVEDTQMGPVVKIGAEKDTNILAHWFIGDSTEAVTDTPKILRFFSTAEKFGGVQQLLSYNYTSNQLNLKPTARLTDTCDSALWKWEKVEKHFEDGQVYSWVHLSTNTQNPKYLCYDQKGALFLSKKLVQESMFMDCRLVVQRPSPPAVQRRGVRIENPFIVTRTEG